MLLWDLVLWKSRVNTRFYHHIIKLTLGNWILQKCYVVSTPCWTQHWPGLRHFLHSWRRRLSHHLILCLVHIRSRKHIELTPHLVSVQNGTSVTETHILQWFLINLVQSTKALLHLKMRSTKRSDLLISSVDDISEHTDQHNISLLYLQ